MSSPRRTSLKWLQLFTIVLWAVAVLGFILGKVLFGAGDIVFGEAGMIFLTVGYELQEAGALVPAAAVVTAIWLHARHVAEVARSKSPSYAVDD